MALASGDAVRAQAKVSILMLTEAGEAFRQLTDVLDAVEGVVCNRHSLDEDAWQSVINCAADMIIIDMCDVDRTTCHLLGKVAAACGSECRMVGVGAAHDPEAIQCLEKMDVLAVGSLPSAQRDILMFCNQLLNERRSCAVQVQSSGNILCSFMSAKGGSGSTTIAVNVAANLARRFEAKACLIDLDVGYGGCAHLLDIKPRHYVTDMLECVGGMDEDKFPGLFSTHSSGVDVLASPPNPLKKNEKIDPSLVAEILELATKCYEITIVDLPRSTEEWAAEVIRRADRKFLIIQNSLSALREVRLINNAFVSLGINPDDIELIVNRAMSRFPSLSTSDIKKNTGCKVMHKIRNDYAAVSVSSDIGEPLGGSFWRSDMLEDVQELARKIWVQHPNSEKYRGHMIRKIMNFTKRKSG